MLYRLKNISQQLGFSLCRGFQLCQAVRACVGAWNWLPLACCCHCLFFSLTPMHFTFGSRVVLI